jgi:hypothetical protein
MRLSDTETDMTRDVIRMADLADRLGSVKMAESDRRRTLMAMRQSENLLDLLQAVFSQARRVLARTRRWWAQAPGEPVFIRSWRGAHAYQSGRGKRVARAHSRQE